MTNRTIRDVVEHQTPVTAPVGMTVRMAAAIMKERRVGAMMVVEQGQLVGVFTERDALCRVVAEGRDATTTTLGEVMTSNPQTVSPEAAFSSALELMHENRFRHVPVVENGRPIGMVSVRDAMGPELESFVYEMLRQEQVSEVLA
ncbi:MAG: CBS domain-containing protein [Burkholderiales bacterium]